MTMNGFSLILLAAIVAYTTALTIPRSSASLFHGLDVRVENAAPLSFPRKMCHSLVMRKQKASFRRTRRMQRGESLDSLSSRGIRPLRQMDTMTNSPMKDADWDLKRAPNRIQVPEKTGGRGRSRKRSNLYSTLSTYHQSFLHELTAEYKAEEDEVLSRLRAASDNPLALEEAGYALFDMFPERRGNLFADEVYRLVKANDATTSYGDSDNNVASLLPPNSKFGTNDVIVLTLQPEGSGDFFGQTSVPTSSKATTAEARVLNTGPTYVDVSLPGGAFEAAFGPAPNNKGPSGKGDARMRLRVDRFFSNVPYQRMVSALGQMTSIPQKRPPKQTDGEAEEDVLDRICMDELFRDTIVSSFGVEDPAYAMVDVPQLARQLARSPLPNSAKLANQVLRYIQTNPHGIFREFNSNQLSAIGAALTRRFTMIQGPPGTGKTTVAGGIVFGFVHQCKSISPNTKVLATAFSNVGADNLAQQLLSVGLKVVRLGKASAVSESLWDYTLDAAVQRDPEAQKAMENAAWATSQLSRRGSSGSNLSLRSKRELATAAVKASIEANNIAATRALREADVIVSTSTGAADPRLLAACGIVLDEDEEIREDGRLKGQQRELKSHNKGTERRLLAPDNKPSLTLPFVLVDEACQSPEPATLIPITSTNSCRAIVLLGDPCQLPPTVRSSPNSPLSISLMERLSALLPQPVIVTAQNDQTNKDNTFLEAKPTKQALSLLRASNRGGISVSYRKRFSGALLLSVQYRMHPSISAFSSALFYDNLLTTPDFLGSYRPFPQELSAHVPASGCDVSVRFVNVGGQQNEQRGMGKQYIGAAVMADAQTSYRNEAEAKRVIEILKGILQSREHGRPSVNTIGIVTPYSGQVALIKDLMKADEEYQLLSQKLHEPVEVKSVDGYQGRERDVIIFSAVRSNRQGNVGFLADWRRMNVALTRARLALVLVGDLATLSEGDRHWAALGKWCAGVKCIVD